MSNPVIKVNNLSKRYRIGAKERYLTFRDAIVDGISAPVRNLAKLRRLTEFKNSKDEEDIIWALKDVSFKVNEGEVLGVIGRNGAGKSTLLKILSRITEPTSGSIEIYGRISSLLEVGTGFHPELTGRENIFLSGAILGMRKHEIEEKFDEIVRFSEIEKFIDTPVKRYSSGMYVRLAFAVSAHLDPDILIVDEVLAVGDIAFQNKCLGKMKDVGRGERTILFVSHNMGAIQQLCDRVILIDKGSIIMDGQTDETIQRYLTDGMERAGERIWRDINKAPGNDVVRVHAIRVTNKFGKVCTIFDVCEPVNIEIEFWVLKEGYSISAQFDLFNATGQVILKTKDNLDSPWSLDVPRPTGLYYNVCAIPGNFLNTSTIFVTYGIDTWLPFRLPPHATERNIISFVITDSRDPRGVRGNFQDEWSSQAVIRPRLQWTVKRKPLDNVRLDLL